VHDLQRKLTAWTGKRWMVVVSQEQGAPTMREMASDREAELKRSVMNDPLVQAVMKKFPGATLGAVTQKGKDQDDAGDVPLAAPADGEDD
jgi:DNA polymerase III subunit gamma/tau